MEDGMRRIVLKLLMTMISVIMMVLGKKAGTDQGMDLHDVTVHPVKQPWLEEDIIRNRHLAYIMNQATEPQSLHVFFTEPLFQAYTPAYFRYSQSMFECGVITVGQHLVHDLKEVGNEIVFLLVGNSQGSLRILALTQFLPEVDVGFFKFDGPFLDPDLEFLLGFRSSSSAVFLWITPATTLAAASRVSSAILSRLASA